jgi:hypothetical protein
MKNRLVISPVTEDKPLVVLSGKIRKLRS